MFIGRLSNIDKQPLSQIVDALIQIINSELPLKTVIPNKIQHIFDYIIKNWEVIQEIQKETLFNFMVIFTQDGQPEDIRKFGFRLILDLKNSEFIIQKIVPQIIILLEFIDPEKNMDNILFLIQEIFPNLGKNDKKKDN